MKKEIILTTTEEIPKRKIAEIIGVARGSTVRARNIGRDIMAGFKNMVGGEIETYTELLNLARDEAYNRMVNNAIEMGADAVVGIRFMTSTVMQGASEIFAYGTAVKLK